MARATRVLLTGGPLPSDLTLADCAGALTERIDGIVVDTYPDPADARDDFDETVGCLVCSQPLDDGGLDFLLDIRDRDPDIPFVYLQTSPGEQVPATALTADITAFVDPTDSASLTTAVADAVIEVLDVTHTSIPPRALPPTLVFDNDGYLDEWTDSASNLFGAEPRAGLAPTELFPDPFADRLTSTVEAALDGGTADGFESPHPTADGWLDATIYPATDSVTIRFDDVTAWHERVTDREQYREIVAHLADPVYVLDEAGQFAFVNDATCELLAYEESDLLGEYVGNFITDEYEQAAIELVRDLWESGESQRGTVEGALVTKHDEHILVENHVTVRPPEDDGTFQGTVGVVRDITGRKRRERELEQYETLIQAIPQALWATDREGYLVFTNQAGIDRFGFDHEEIDAGEVHFSEVLSDEAVAKFDEATRQLLSEDDDLGGKAVIEHTVETRDGRLFQAETHYSLLPPADDGVGGAGIVQDISERKQRRQRLQVLNRVLRHNLRNDLTVAITNADILTERLREEYGDYDSAELAAEIRTVSRDIISISDDIRRIQEALEHDGIEQYDIDAVDVVETVADSLREEYPDARIDVDLPECAPVEADPSLELAVWNLVENAIEHNDRSVPTVSVSITREETERGQWFALSVADNGPGIPNQERVVIDDTNEATPLKHSSGVGLWSATWIVQSFEGTIDIADNDPRGSVVTLRFRRSE